MTEPMTEEDIAYMSDADPPETALVQVVRSILRGGAVESKIGKDDGQRRRRRDSPIRAGAGARAGAAAEARARWARGAREGAATRALGDPGHPRWHGGSAQTQVARSGLRGQSVPRLLGRDGGQRACAFLPAVREERLQSIGHAARRGGGALAQPRRS